MDLESDKIMARYHVRADGSMGVCTAREGNCPFGGDAGTKHFTNESEARSYSEKIIAEFTEPHDGLRKTRNHKIAANTVDDSDNSTSDSVDFHRTEKLFNHIDRMNKIMRSDPRRTAEVSVDFKNMIHLSSDADSSEKNGTVSREEMDEFVKVYTSPVGTDWPRYVVDHGLGKVDVMMETIDHPMALDPSYDPDEYSEGEAYLQYCANLKTMHVINGNGFLNPSDKLWTKDQDGRTVIPFPYKIRGDLNSMINYVDEGWSKGSRNDPRTRIPTNSRMSSIAFSTYFAKPGSYLVIDQAKPDDYLDLRELGARYDSGESVEESRVDLSPILERIDPDSDEAREIINNNQCANIDYLFRDDIQTYEDVYEKHLKEWVDGGQVYKGYDPKDSMLCLRGLMLKKKLLDAEFDHGEHGDKVSMTPRQLNVICSGLLSNGRLDVKALRRGNDIYVLRTPSWTVSPLQLMKQERSTENHEEIMGV